MKAWIIDYLPELADVVGRDDVLQRMARYLDDYKHQKPIFLSGPSGCGKTSVALALAKERDMEVIEVNASDTRNKVSILSIIGEAMKQQSLFMRERLILIDEVDGVSGRSDRGGVITLVNLIKESKHPIIFTATDAMIDKLKALRKACQVIQLDPLPNDIIIKRLTQIAKSEKTGLSETTITAISRHSGGDMRAAINDLQTVASTGTDDLSILGDRDHTAAIEDALTRVFKTTKAEVALPAYDNVDEGLDKIFLWLDENLPREYTKPDDIARAYDAMSLADVFFGRIRRWQYYRYYVYVYNLLSAGVALAKDEKYKSIPNYKRSDRPLKIWIANNANARKKAIAAKIAEGTHASTRRVVQEMPLHIRACRDKNYLAMLEDRFDLDSDEVDWLAKKAIA